MPTYEYECDACGHAFERLQSMSEPAVRKCPKCGKLKVRRLISGGAGVIFKGSGFYETDYKRARSSSDTAKRKEDAAQATSSQSEPPKTETKPDAKSDAKPESKPESKSSDAKPAKEPSKKKDKA
jgi:putative FmdB family regulatory protein